MCIRCPLLRWKNAELTQLRGSKVGDGDGVWMRDIYWGWVRATKKKEGLERRRWTSCQLDNLHQPSKGSGPTWPVCIIWEGLTCSLLLLPHVGICEKVCTLGKMDFSRSGACRSGGSWRSQHCRLPAITWGWEWAFFQKGIWLGISMFATKTLIQPLRECENCKSWSSGPGWVEPKQYDHNN